MFHHCVKDDHTKQTCAWQRQPRINAHRREMGVLRVHSSEGPPTNQRGIYQSWVSVVQWAAFPFDTASLFHLASLSRVLYVNSWSMTRFGLLPVSQGAP